MRAFVLAPLCLAVACGSSSEPAAAPDTLVAPGATCTAAPVVHDGLITYYDTADGSGNCGFPATPNDLMVGAMNHAEYAGSAACGMCARIRRDANEITVRIVDQCPECGLGHIDLSPSAFAALAPTDLGRVSVQWQYVACNVSGSVVYHFKDGSNQWWTAVQIRNHRYGIAKLEYKNGNGAWVDVPRLDYNYFVAGSGMGPGPYSFRVTDVNGAVIEDSGIPLAPDGDSPGASQFPACS